MEVRRIVQTIRRSKEKQMDRHQGSVPGTPQSSDDDDEDDGGHYARDEAAVRRIVQIIRRCEEKQWDTPRVFPRYTTII